MTDKPSEEGLGVGIDVSLDIRYHDNHYGTEDERRVQVENLRDVAKKLDQYLPGVRDENPPRMHLQYRPVGKSVEQCAIEMFEAFINEAGVPHWELGYYAIEVTWA